MDQVGGIIWDFTKCFCICAKNEAAYIYDLEEILKSLEEKWEDLQSMKEDLNKRVDEAENIRGMQRANEIDRWLKKVDGIQRGITDTQAKGAKEIEDKCLSKCCPKNCMSSYELGKKATKMLENVNQLAAEGKRYSGNFRIALNIPPKPMEMPQDESVGLDLTSSSWTATNVKTKAFSMRKLSYDKLDEVQKCCFLYCAMYPEDFEILVPDLIDKWMWEKLLGEDMSKSVQDMRDHGESVIEKLKLSRLLESVEDDLFMDRMVKMHDMIRDMALWILEHDKYKMELLKRISITYDWESHKIPDPPTVTTLVLLKDRSFVYMRRNLEDIKCTMKRLKVLELHVEGEGFLDIGGLISLEYLSFHLKGNPPRPEFWMNLKSLKNLKFLAFRSIGVYIQDPDIPLGVLSSFQQLRVFKLFRSGIFVTQERRFLDELESLPYFEELWIEAVTTEDGLNKLLESTKLKSCIYSLSIRHLYNSNDEKTLLSLESMSRIKQLYQLFVSGLFSSRSHYQYSPVLETCFLAKVRRVKIDQCGVPHVTWLKYAPLLQQLIIFECGTMEEVIKEEAAKDRHVDSSCVFSSLVVLSLGFMPMLKSVHTTPLPFPSLKSIYIEFCPNLKKLPLDSNCAKHNLTLIKGEQDWWDSLEWEDPTAKSILQSKFEHRSLWN